MRSVAALLVLSFCLALASASFEPASPAAGCSGKPNLSPIYDDAPQFVKSVPNGKLYIQRNVTPPVYIVHLYGTAYEMGYAQGQLFKDIGPKFWPSIMEYIYSQIDQYLKMFPEWLQHLIAESGVDAALDITGYMTEAYTPKRFFDEIRGIADGSGTDYTTLYRIHMFPELIQAACSMFGAWGKAIANTNGTLYQLRALDWSTDGPFQQMPAVLVYHPNEGDGHTFASFGWAGFIGTISGYSSSHMGVCEKVWAGYNGTLARVGVPWHFLLRDIMQYDTDIADATMRMEAARRTCAIFVGLGDYTNTFTAFGYTHDKLHIWDWKNFPVYPDHPKMEGLVYLDKHPQPSEHVCFSSLLQQYYGSITPQNTIKYITSQGETGDMQIAVYDFASDHVYLANAGPAPNAVPAYKRPFIRLDMARLFAEPKP
ncbi:Nacylsphingosine amidohydrolase, putative [Acanthamoeba castellanii str. Neff]|uniref:Nacylsphingosine amidohydrolase, putative n=1 Tax=Acanthamoeba castellanii (strain ATCC 30010 / Neff) TaxID=1257118 RepID=L8GY45_ACACF|nr:Nacylsphingosine amidohydrolase, putative [Acanthamoeba castellanii str. Neff]ELR17473.1 Nacylsphingosine amidohydrolase, putative [Acanthamoeba castellanii str. Neff]